MSKGFTLLELVLVVAILSTVALATVNLVDGADRQLRYEDTQSRLAMLRRAITGGEARQVGGQTFVSGFVADVGRVPTSLDELVNGAHPDHFGPNASALRMPVFDGKPGPDLFNNGPASTGVIPLDSANPREIVLEDASPVLKGYRGGYVPVLPTTAGTERHTFFDGFGNEGEADDVNFGWRYESLPSEDPVRVEIESAGALEGTYATTMTEVVDQDRYTFHLAGESVQIRNASEDPLPESLYHVALLVFVEAADGVEGRWKHLFSEPLSGVITNDPADPPAPIDFPAYPADPEHDRIPIGTHHLILVEDDSANPGIYRPVERDNGGYYTQRVTFLAGASLAGPIEFILR